MPAGKAKKGKPDKLKDGEAQEIKALNAKCAEVPEFEGRRFASLPLSQRTQEALKSAGYVDMTDIQLQAVPLALAGRDVLGAAKTGSGKTLAFLIPVLEKLYRMKWAAVFGVGAVIISPTRELAYQTFEVLRKVGKKHDFSAGLIIGGKDFAAEQGLINNMNILICTPGRLLQHMDETPDFSCQDMQILVLDEADRILDMGFEKTVNAIIENLPRARQTLLFSATQTKSVKDLARLSLKDPEYVAVHEKDRHSTPDQLLQTVLVCELPEKMDILYSFLRTHTNDKLLVFVSSCKQVRFLYETFRRMRPGVPLMALYGKQKQMKRMAIYNDFCKKKSACLFATDIAARGLDFPAVNWVVQFDCPEDVATYIHRAGRTARYKSGGKALLMLLPSEEEGMMANLDAAKIPITRIKVNPAKAQSCMVQFQNMCAADPEIKHLAQKSLVSYVRSVYLQKDKSVFDVNKLPLTEFALSLGLAKAPKIRFVSKQAKKFGGEDGSEGSAPKAKPVGKSSGSGSDMDGNVAGSTDDESEDDGGQRGGAEWSGSDDEGGEDFLVRKGAPDTHLSDEEEVAKELAEARKKKEKKVTKAAQAKKLLNKGIANPQKVKFDEETGAPLVDGAVAMATEAVEEDSDGEGGIDIEKVKAKLRLQDKHDREAERQRVKAMHKEKRAKERERRKAESVGSLLPTSGEGIPTVEPHYLGSGSDGEEDGQGESGSADSGSDEDDYERPGSQKRSRATLRQGSESDSDGDMSASDDEGHEANWGSKRSRTLEADEALALKLLAK